MGNWYHLNIDEVLSQFNSTADRGLSKAEASRRLMECGPNELQAARRISPLADNPPKPWRLRPDLPTPVVAGFAKAGALRRPGE